MQCQSVSTTFSSPPPPTLFAVSSAVCCSLHPRRLLPPPSPRAPLVQYYQAITRFRRSVALPPYQPCTAAALRFFSSSDESEEQCQHRGQATHDAQSIHSSNDVARQSERDRERETKPKQKRKSTSMLN